jgi:hypothetical protein
MVCIHAKYAEEDDSNYVTFKLAGWKSMSYPASFLARYRRVSQSCCCFCWDLIVLQVLISMGSNMLGFHLLVLHINLVSTQYNWNVLTYPAQASQSTHEHSFRRQQGRQLPTLLVFKVNKPTSLHSKQHAIVKHGGVVLYLITCKDQNAMLEHSCRSPLQ